MSRIRSRKIWTVEEDALLRSLVERYGDARGPQSKWKIMADKIPGRTTKDCRKRWFHSLDPNVRKGRWTAEEDQILKQAYQDLGPAWHIIASMISGRKDDQCAKRYNEILDPSASNRLRQWTPQEDAILCQGVRELGNQWSVLAQRLPGRPPLTCRNRWRALSRCGEGSPATASARRRACTETPQSETTTPQNTSTPTPPDSEAMPAAATTPVADHIVAASTGVSDMFFNTLELEGLDEWWDNSFLYGASSWLDVPGSPASREQQPPQPPPQQPKHTPQTYTTDDPQASFLTDATIPLFGAGDAPFDPCEAAPAILPTVPSPAASATDSPGEELPLSQMAAYPIPGIEAAPPVQGQYPLPTPDLQRQPCPTAVAASGAQLIYHHHHHHYYHYYHNEREA